MFIIVITVIIIIVVIKQTSQWLEDQFLQNILLNIIS